MATLRSYDVNQLFPVEKIKKILGIRPQPFYGAIGQGAAIKQTHVKWYDDGVVGTKTTLSADVLDATTTTFSVTNAAVFAPGDIAVVGSERVKVVSVDYTGNTIEVIRGYQGTTATTHSTGDTIEVVSTVVDEGSVVPGSRSATPKVYENYTQIFQDIVVVTGTLNAVEPEWGDSEKNRQLKHKLHRLEVLKERSVLYGIPYDSASAAERTMGGIDYYIQNKVNVSAALTPDVLIDQIVEMQNEGVFDAGLNCEIWMNPEFQKVVNTWYDSQLIVNQETDQYGQVITSIATNAGTFKIRYSPNIKLGDIFLIDPKQVKKRVLRPETREILAKTDDSIKVLILEEFTVEVLYPSAWRKLENVTLS